MDKSKHRDSAIRSLASLAGTTTKTIIRDIKAYNQAFGTNHSTSLKEASLSLEIVSYLAKTRNFPLSNTWPFTNSKEEKAEQVKVVAVVPDGNEILTKINIDNFREATESQIKQNEALDKENQLKPPSTPEKAKSPLLASQVLSGGKKTDFDPIAFMFSGKISVSVIVLALLASQAYIFADLASQHLHIKSYFLFVPAFFFEGAALSLSLMPLSGSLSVWDKISLLEKKMLWVYLFAVVQFIVDLLYTGLFEKWDNLSWPQVLAKVLIAAALPLAISAYCFIYNYRTNDKS